MRGVLTEGGGSWAVGFKKRVNMILVDVWRCRWVGERLPECHCTYNSSCLGAGNGSGSAGSIAALSAGEGSERGSNKGA